MNFELSDILFIKNYIFIIYLFVHRTFGQLISYFVLYPCRVLGILFIFQTSNLSSSTKYEVCFNVEHKSTLKTTCKRLYIDIVE